MENDTKFEIWENPSKSIVVTVKTDHLGRETRVQTRGGARLQITPEDRALNQERTPNDKHDPFKNGLLAPISLVTEEDAEVAGENPNHLTEEGLQNLLSASPREFGERLLAITSEPVLRRLRVVAREADIKPSRQEAIQMRLEAVAPAAKVEPGPEDADISRRAIPVS